MMHFFVMFAPGDRAVMFGGGGCSVGNADINLGGRDRRPKRSGE